MRILKTAIVTVIVMVSGAAPAAAQNYYAGGLLGASGGGGALSLFGLDLVLESGVVASAFVGKDSGKVRYEAELAHRENDLLTFFLVPVNGDMTSDSLMGNIYYEFGDGEGLGPWIGFGLGATNLTLDSSSGLINVSDTVLTFAGQAMLGIDVPITNALLFVVDWRAFLATGDFETNLGAPFQQAYRVSSLSVGLRYNF